jgi:hypothetical protein
MAEIDPARLYAALEHTYAPDPVVRRAAEAQIEAAKGTPGALLICLLRIVTANDAAREVRQAGSITLKNLIRARWDKRLPTNAPALQAEAVTPQALITDGQSLI